MTIDHIIMLLKTILELAHFQWQNEFYAQTDGCAMGDGTSSPLSNAFMGDFEEAALTKYCTLHDPPLSPASTSTIVEGDLPLPPLTSTNGTPQQPIISVIQFWYCQADDTLTSIHCDNEEPFFNFLNSQHHKIKWTRKKKEDGKISMLDLTIICQPDGKLEFDVYRKPTHTDQYIPWDSDLPLHHKGATITALTRRAALLPSGPERQATEYHRIKEVLARLHQPQTLYSHTHILHHPNGPNYMSTAQSHRLSPIPPRHHRDDQMCYAQS
jgi:hypothetical protein